VENLQNKYKRLDIRKYTLPELEIILKLGNFDEFTKEVFKRLNNGDTIVKISMDLTDIEKYGYVSIKKVNKAIKEIKNKIVRLTLLGKLR
jgi:hypothetical protein